MTLHNTTTPSPMCGDARNAATSHLFLSKRTVHVFGAPVNFGQTLSGVSKGPNALRKAGLGNVAAAMKWDLVDGGNISVDDDGHGKEETPVDKRQREVPSEIYTEDELPKSFELGVACGNIFRSVKAAAATKSFVLTLGGDHSIAAGTLTGMLSEYPDLCVVWVDAHGDINTPEVSPSRLYHGMPSGHVLGWFGKRASGFSWMDAAPVLRESRLGYIGLRDIDKEERELINNSSVIAKTVQDVEADGIRNVVDNVLAAIDPHNKRPIHLSFDIDGCDPSIAPGTGTRARGGLSYREAHYICQKLYSTRRLVSMDLVEVNPDIDQPDEFLHGDDPCIAPEATKTVRLALELISSSLGFRIL